MTMEDDDREPITVRPNKPAFQVTDIEVVVNPANPKHEDEVRMKTNIPQAKDLNGDVFVTFTT